MKQTLQSFFGVAATYHDGRIHLSSRFRATAFDFLLTLFDLEGAVYVSIWRDRLPDPLFTVVRESCTHAQLATDTRQRRCLEVGSPEHPRLNGDSAIAGFAACEFM